MLHHAKCILIDQSLQNALLLEWVLPDFVGGSDALTVLQLSVEHVLHCQSEMPVIP